MIEAAEQPLAYIFNTFKEGNKVQLKNIKAYFDANKNLKEQCKIFIKKLETYLSSKNPTLLTQDDFFGYFNQSVSDPGHFKAVFDSIDNDNSGFISKSQLKDLFRRFSVPYTEEDVNLMVEVCSTDGQKIRRRDLQQFLSK